MESRTRSDKATTTATTTTRLKRFAITMLAAVTVAIGGLTIVPTASALPMTCQQREGLARSYWATGAAFYSVGAYVDAFYWIGKAEGLMVGC
jgi:hypothetical protein